MFTREGSKLGVTEPLGPGSYVGKNGGHVADLIFRVSRVLLCLIQQCARHLAANTSVWTVKARNSVRLIASYWWNNPEDLYMNLILLILILLLLFGGGGGYYYGGPYMGGGIGTVVLIILIVYLLMGRKRI